MSDGTWRVGCVDDMISKRLAWGGLAVLLAAATSANAASYWWYYHLADCSGLDIKHVRGVASAAWLARR